MKKRSKPRKKQKLTESGYFEHLEVLRWNIITVLALLLVSTVLSFIYIEKIMLFLQKPASGIEISLNYFSPQEKFLTYIKLSFFSGIFFTVIPSLFIAAGFIYPALKKAEKPAFFAALAAIPALFIAGCWLGYGVLSPFALRFLTGFASGDNVQALWGIAAYFNFLAVVTLGSGAAFLAPAALFALMAAGIIDARAAEKMRPYAIVLIFILAAAVTPPDVVTQILIAVPLWILFEITILAGKLVQKDS